MIERILHAGEELAVILRRDFRRDGIEFLTASDYSQQLGYMNRPAGYVILPHVHAPVAREVRDTMEVLFVKSGRVRVDFYSGAQAYLESTVLETGDVILLAGGGHGVEMLEPSELVEVKQGPYVGDRDKIRFEPVARDRIRLRGAER